MNRCFIGMRACMDCRSFTPLTCTTAVDGYRLMLASAALGAARVALAAACDHLKERTTYKGQQRVLDQQALQLALVGLHAELRSARALVLDAAHSMDCKVAAPCTWRVFLSRRALACQRHRVCVECFALPVMQD